MVEIKENDVKMSDLVDKLVPNVIKALEERNTYYLYRYSSGVSYDTAKALAMRFIKKAIMPRLTISTTAERVINVW